MNNIPYKSTKAEKVVLISVIVLFNLVGLIGFLTPAVQSFFLMIVPWHLVLMLMVIIASHKPTKGRFLIFGSIVFISAFIIEWIGVHKSWPFGDYFYGSTLGSKLAGVPLTIGINWFLLIYCTGVFLQRSRVRNMYMRIFTGACILVLLDFLIEPVAMRFDYWHWAGNLIPLKNYAGWFLVSAVMLFVFEKFRFRRQSIVAPVLLMIQFVFFAVLNFF